MSSPLVPRLKRELSRNYKKTAILGLVCLVALYFWAPLVMKWAFPSHTVVAALPATEPMPAATPIAANVGESQGTVALHALPRWDVLLAARNSDERATALNEVSTNLRNPFRAVGVTEFPEPEVALETDAKVEIPNPQIAAVEIDPKAAGIVVTATVLGSRPSALINGYRYTVGERLVVRKVNASTDDPNRDLVFEVTEITSDTVVLSHDGTKFPLHLQKSSLAQGDWMTVRSHAP